MTEQAKQTAVWAVQTLDKHLAKDVRMIDVEAVTSVCDVFVIAHGNSSTQVRALADYVEKELKEKHGIEPLRVEGYNATGWILVDYGDVVVHIFHEETRGFYDLERLWKDGTEVDINEFLESEETIG
ncbi:MAG: ribosome silencing factor [Clostridia bacterium]|nr:ribosome silencing factor [Clostridia bacterium]